MGIKSGIFIVLTICVMIAASGYTVFADEFHSPEDTSPQKVVGGMGNKAVRGIANVTTGWLELPKQIYVTANEDGAASAVFVGPLKGIGMTLVRTLVGVAELATFFIPYPGYYDPYFEPPFVWQEE